MGLFSIVGGLGKKIVDRKKKKMKRRMIIIAIIILVVFFVIPIVLFAKNFRDNLRMAAISSSNENVDGDGNWYTRDGTNGKKNKKKIRVAKSISMDAGFTGLGYDFHAAIAGSNNNDEKYYAYQTLELLDVMSIEAKQPFTLYGIGLLTKECNYFTSYKSESRRALFFPAGTDIYTHRGEYSRAPGIGGGRLWHSKGSTYESARAATDAPQNDWIVQKSSGDWGYWNAGAFGFAQLETYIWLDSSPNGAAKYSEKGYATIDLDSKGGEISSMDKYEAYCRRVMEAVGHADFIAEADANAAANGYNHEGQYLKYIRDVNMATSACFLSCARLANCGSYFPNDKMGGTKTSGCWTVTNGGDIDILNMGQGISGIDTSYMKLENLNEMELNVLSAMVGLSGWNGGYSGWLTNGKSGVTEDKKYQRMLAYDLAKFLVANGAEPFYSGGYKELSNKCYVSASSEQGKKLSSDFALITQLLYKNDQAKQTAVYNHFSQYWSGGTAKYIAYVYMLDGIIRAQQTFDQLGLVASDGSKKNIYACVYEGTVVTIYEEYYEDGSDIDEAGTVTDANAYLNMDAAIVAFGSGTMIEDWCTKPGKQFNFDGVDVEAQAAIVKMITEGHTIWRHNQDLLLQKGWLRPESYLSIRERYDIPSEYFRDIYNYILTQHKENWPAEQRIVYYSQSKHRIYSIKDLLNKNSSNWSDFDCSSFMSYLLLKINVDLADVHSTGSFDSDLQKLGFTLVDTGSLDYSKLRTGDIINVAGSHIAMVVFPGTKKSDTWILESVTTSSFRFKWDTGSYSSSYGVGSSANTCCGPSITLHNNEARENGVKVWRLNKNVKFSTN